MRYTKFNYNLAITAFLFMLFSISLALDTTETLDKTIDSSQKTSDTNFFAELIKTIKESYPVTAAFIFLLLGSIVLFKIGMLYKGSQVSLKTSVSSKVSPLNLSTAVLPNPTQAAITPSTVQPVINVISEQQTPLVQPTLTSPTQQTLVSSPSSSMKSANSASASINSFPSFVSPPIQAAQSSRLVGSSFESNTPPRPRSISTPGFQISSPGFKGIPRVPGSPSLTLPGLWTQILAESSKFSPTTQSSPQLSAYGVSSI